MDSLGDTNSKQIGYKILYECHNRIGVYTCCIYCPRKIIVERLNLKNPRVKRKKNQRILIVDIVSDLLDLLLVLFTCTGIV